MIGRLTGRVVDEEATGGLVLDVRGVGYELACPVGTAARAKTVGDAGDVVLYVHTNLRQDALVLYGFPAPEERVAFEKLITVPNVGPRLALSILNVLSAYELADIIDAEDKVRLSKVPGIGKKTAERLVLELRGKMPRAGANAPASLSLKPAPKIDLSARLVAALTGLGYRTQEAEKAAAALLTQDPQEKDLSTLLREALKYLAP